jgi:hypothetical protein
LWQYQAVAIVDATARGTEVEMKLNESFGRHHIISRLALIEPISFDRMSKLHFFSPLLSQMACGVIALIVAPEIRDLVKNVCASVLEKTPSFGSVSSHRRILWSTCEKLSGDLCSTVGSPVVFQRLILNFLRLTSGGQRGGE